jgi:hypothetical protein
MQCPRIYLPTNYLGLPLTINKPNKQTYIRLISKAQQRYDEFAGKYLSPAGRAVLSNTVLNVMPLNYMQAFMLPKWVLHTLNKINRKFLWRGIDGKFSGGTVLCRGNESLSLNASEGWG